jgi:3-dehydroquinate synthase
MIKTEYRFTFGTTESRVCIGETLPLPGEWGEAGKSRTSRSLVVCDVNTEYIARRLPENDDPPEGPCCVLPAGETAKTWESVDRILKDAYAAGLGRDSLIVGVGGGVITDIAGFAASVYMRGIGLRLVSTTLLGMVDASVGGKTGFDFGGIKNLAGTFYPAGTVYMPLDSLATLPPGEWKSGFAEIIKTAILADDREMLSRIDAYRDIYANILNAKDAKDKNRDEFKIGELGFLISRAVEIKGRIVEEDPRETGERRALLNLGHTFGHALESSAGLGHLTHGEAVAWGIIRASELGYALGVTSREQALEIGELIRSYGYITEAPHPAMGNREEYYRALEGDKKKKAGEMVFIVPGRGSAQKVIVDPKNLKSLAVLKSIINGEYHGLFTKAG